ncbi:MAG: hypothetical protein LBS44_05515, partial [Deltaproteobacteria bacterium]|nr:hypothetical protein [Deltaproteobacteria bacterium]
MKTSNGVAAVFSLDFQINAAIILMLINIEKANKVKVERETGRVDITFSDNKLLIAQVKAVVNPHDFSQVKEKLEKGLQSLNQAAKFSDVEQLVYITNSPNPFNEGKYRFINAVNMCPFSELPLNCQQIIIDICQSQNYDLDQTLLTIGVIQFFGQNEDERYKVMFSRIEEFLKNIEANSISIKELLTIWQNSFRQKASQKELTITKNDMIWPIIASVCKINEEAARLIDYDNQDIDEI